MLYFCILKIDRDDDVFDATPIIDCAQQAMCCDQTTIDVAVGHDRNASCSSSQLMMEEVSRILEEVLVILKETSISSRLALRF